MRPGDSFKFYINFFQSQLTKVSNCGEVFALTFISGMQVTYLLYKHLLKHVAKMSEVLSRAQPYIQLEETMKASSNHPTKPGKDRVKWKSTHEAPKHAPDRHWRQPPYKKQTLFILSPSPIQSYRLTEHFTPLTLTINKVFNTFKNQPWVRQPKPIQPNPSLPGSEEYCSYHDCKGHQTIHCWALRRYLEELI